MKHGVGGRWLEVQVQFANKRRTAVWDNKVKNHHVFSGKLMFLNYHKYNILCQTKGSTGFISKASIITKGT